MRGGGEAPARPRGRPRRDHPHLDAQRAAVMRALGIPARQVALALDISERTVRSWTRRVLETPSLTE